MPKISGKLISKYITSTPISKYFLASSDYRLIGGDHILRLSSNFTTRSWDSYMANRQNKTWEKILDKSLSSTKRPDIQNLINALNIYASSKESILEIGSGACYNSRLIRNVYPDVKYIGLDSSLVSLLLNHDKRNILINSSADEISLQNNKVDIVLDGATLIHLPNWINSLQEYFRVANKIIILHSINVSEDKYFNFTKYAYGRKIFEQCFNRNSLEEITKLFNWSVIDVYTGLDYDLGIHFGNEFKSQSETWVLGK